MQVMNETQLIFEYMQPSDGMSAWIPSFNGGFGAVPPACRGRPTADLGIQ